MRPAPLEAVGHRGRAAAPDEDEETAFAPRPRGRWSAESERFRVQAGVRIPAGDDEGRERLRRYAARLGLAPGE